MPTFVNSGTHSEAFSKPRYFSPISTRERLLHDDSFWTRLNLSDTSSDRSFPIKGCMDLCKENGKKKLPNQSLLIKLFMERSPSKKKNPIKSFFIKQQTRKSLSNQTGGKKDHSVEKLHLFPAVNSFGL